MILGTMSASTTTVLNLTYLPEELYFVAATAPSALRVSVLGEGVILDLDAAGVMAMSNIRGISRVTNAFSIPLADGLIKGKNVEISFTNTVAGAVILYGFSERIGSLYVQSLRQQVFANSGALFEDFAVLAFPGAGASDTFDIAFHDGLSQRMVRDELAAKNMQMQDNSSSFIIDNLDGFIKSVTIVPAANQTAYLMRFAEKREVSGAIFDQL